MKHMLFFSCEKLGQWGAPPATLPSSRPPPRPLRCDSGWRLRPPRPPDDAALRQSWRTFHATLQWVLPARGALHNADQADLGSMITMLRDEPPTIQHAGGALTRGPDEVPSARFLS